MKTNKYPLKPVTCYVEARNCDGSDATTSTAKVLQSLGATVEYGGLRMGLTHLIWSNGNLKHVRAAQLMDIIVVSPLWVEKCRDLNNHVDETDYLVDPDNPIVVGLALPAVPIFREPPKVDRVVLREPESPFFDSSKRIESLQLINKGRGKGGSKVSSQKRSSITAHDENMTIPKTVTSDPNITEGNVEGMSTSTSTSASVSIGQGKSKGSSKRVREPSLPIVPQTKDIDVVVLDDDLRVRDRGRVVSSRRHSSVSSLRRPCVRTSEVNLDNDDNDDDDDHHSVGDDHDDNGDAEVEVDEDTAAINNNNDIFSGGKASRRRLNNNNNNSLTAPAPTPVSLPVPVPVPVHVPVTVVASKTDKKSKITTNKEHPSVSKKIPIFNNKRSLLSCSSSSTSTSLPASGSLSMGSVSKRMKENEDEYDEHNTITTNNHNNVNVNVSCLSPKGLVVGLSGFDGKEERATMQSVLSAVVCQAGGRELREEDDPDADCSVLIAPALSCKRTLRILFCLARGRPIVSEIWLYACLEAGAWIHPHSPPTGASTAVPGSQSTEDSSFVCRSFLHPRFGRRPLSLPDDIDTDISSDVRQRRSPASITVSSVVVPPRGLLSGCSVYLSSVYDTHHDLKTAKTQAQTQVVDPGKPVLSALITGCGGTVARGRKSADVEMTTTTTTLSVDNAVSRRVGDVHTPKLLSIKGLFDAIEADKLPWSDNEQHQQHQQKPSRAEISPIITIAKTTSTSTTLTAREQHSSNSTTNSYRNNNVNITNNTNTNTNIPSGRRLHNGSLSPPTTTTVTSTVACTTNIDMDRDMGVDTHKEKVKINKARPSSSSSSLSARDRMSGNVNEPVYIGDKGTAAVVGRKSVSSTEHIQVDKKRPSVATAVSTSSPAAAAAIVTKPIQDQHLQGIDININMNRSEEKSKNNSNNRRRESGMSISGRMSGTGSGAKGKENRISLDLTATRRRLSAHSSRQVVDDNSESEEEEWEEEEAACTKTVVKGAKNATPPQQRLPQSPSSPMNRGEVLELDLMAGVSESPSW
eukprot:gene3429-6807_t